MGYSKDFDLLLNRICVGLGFCGAIVDGKSTHLTDFIPESGKVTADQFVEFVLRGDGFDPASHLLSSSLIRQIRQTFIDHMGADTVDASEFHWS